MSLADIQHQGNAQRQIQRAIAHDRLPHAYLFHGPDGVGKEALALGLAEVLLCGESADRSLNGEEADNVGIDRVKVGCGCCEDCRSVSGESHPDLHLVYRQLNREHPDATIRKRKALDIGIDVLRHFVIERVAMTPSRGRAKVFIVREADRMTVGAQNALLKTLEEPPGAAMLMLLVSALDRLLPTTLSRCQVVRFDALPTMFVQRKLARRHAALSDDECEWYARCSEGSLGTAMEYVEDGFLDLFVRLAQGLSRLVQPVNAAEGAARKPLGTKETTTPTIALDPKSWIDASKSLGDRYRKRDPDISDTEAGRRGLKALFRLASEWFADRLRCAVGDQPEATGSEFGSPSGCSELRLSGQVTGAAIQRLAQAEKHLDLNANTQLCVETLIHDLEGMTALQPARIE